MVRRLRGFREVPARRPECTRATAWSPSPISPSNALDVTAVLARLGSWKKVEYKILHNGVEVPTNVIIGEAERDSTIFYQYAVGAVYLAIGLFVYFRRGSAPRALHFFMLCVASFVLFTFHYSGKLNNFDKVIYLGNLVAGFLAPTLFLHFCCVFPEPQKWIRKRGSAALLYVPGLALLAIHLALVFGWVTHRPRRCSKCAGCSIASGWASSARCIWPGGTSSPRSYARRRSRSPPSIDLAAQRRGSRHRAVRRDLCGPVLDGRSTQSRHEPGGAVAAADPAHLGLRDPALPPDGRRHHLPGRLRLHAGDVVRPGHFLRRDLLGQQGQRSQAARRWWR